MPTKKKETYVRNYAPGRQEAVFLAREDPESPRWNDMALVEEVARSKRHGQAWPVRSFSKACLAEQDTKEINLVVLFSPI